MTNCEWLQSLPPADMASVFAKLGSRSEKLWLDWLNTEHIVCLPESEDGKEEKIGARNFASYIIVRCIEEKRHISNLQLQRLLYLLQKYYMQSHLQAFDDDFAAWTFGPCIPSVYYAYCGYGAMEIRMLIDADISRADRLSQNDKLHTQVIIDKYASHPLRDLTPIVMPTGELGAKHIATVLDGIT